MTPRPKRRRPHAEQITDAIHTARSRIASAHDMIVEATQRVDGAISTAHPDDGAIFEADEVLTLLLVAVRHARSVLERLVDETAPAA